MGLDGEERRREEGREESNLRLVGGEEERGGEGEGMGRRNMRKVGKGDIHRVLLTLSQRIDILIITMIVQEFITLGKGIHVIRIR
jgi:hypothetical protein